LAPNRTTPWLDAADLSGDGLTGHYLPGRSG